LLVGIPKVWEQVAKPALLLKLFRSRLARPARLLLNYSHSLRGRVEIHLYIYLFITNQQMITITNPEYRLISDHQFAVVRQNLLNNQKAFFAQISYKAGDVVSTFHAGAVLDQPTYLTVQVDVHSHILLQPEHLQYINHSCNPNVFFDTHAMVIVALKDICVGDEMTFFYPSTEWDMAQPFTCNCNHSNCLGQIRGAAHIPLDIIRNYKLTRFIQQQLHDRSGTERRA